MTSMSDLAGQSLTWVPSRKFWELIASDNSVIATFPVEKSTTRLVGIAGTRWEKAKALIPDGTGALFLNAEGRDVAIYTIEQGPRFAIYKEPWLVFPDGRRFLWVRVSFSLKYLNRSGEGAWMNEAHTITYVEIRDGMRKKHVDIRPAGARMLDPELSLLLVLGLYNIYIEDTTSFTAEPPILWKNVNGLSGTGSERARQRRQQGGPNRNRCAAGIKALSERSDRTGIGLQRPSWRHRRTSACPPPRRRPAARLGWSSS